MPLPAHFCASAMATPESASARASGGMLGKAIHPLIGRLRRAQRFTDQAARAREEDGARSERLVTSSRLIFNRSSNCLRLNCGCPATGSSSPGFRMELPQRLPAWLIKMDIKSGQNQRARWVAGNGLREDRRSPEWSRWSPQQSPVRHGAGNSVDLPGQHLVAPLHRIHKTQLLEMGRPEIGRNLQKFKASFARRPRNRRAPDPQAKTSWTAPGAPRQSAPVDQWQDRPHP